MILKNKIEVVAQQDELLWKINFVKTMDIEKLTEIMTIEYDHSNGEGLAMLSS